VEVICISRDSVTRFQQRGCYDSKDLYQVMPRVSFIWVSAAFIGAFMLVMTVLNPEFKPIVNV
jgi:hypothetical protein